MPGVSHTTYSGQVNARNMLWQRCESYSEVVIFMVQFLNIHFILFTVSFWAYTDAMGLYRWHGRLSDPILTPMLGYKSTDFVYIFDFKK